MKEVKHYVCEVCGTEYSDKEKCKVCESSHKKIKAIISAKYYSFSQNHKGYPSSVVVEMDDGKQIVYKR